MFELGEHGLGVVLVDLDRGVVRVLKIHLVLGFLVKFLELAHFVQFEVIVILPWLRCLTVSVLGMARVQTLLLGLELDSVVLVCLLLLFTEEQIHGDFKLIDFVDGHFGRLGRVGLLARGA